MCEYEYTMTVTHMSDGRNFTDYTSAKERMSHYRKEYKIGDSKSLRSSLVNNAQSVMQNNQCTPKQASGMAVICGGPMAQYVSTKSTITEFPKGPLHLAQ